MGLHTIGNARGEKTKPEGVVSGVEYYFSDIHDGASSRAIAKGLKDNTFFPFYITKTGTVKLLDVDKTNDDTIEATAQRLYEYNLGEIRARAAQNNNNIEAELEEIMQNAGDNTVHYWVSHENDSARIDIQRGGTGVPRFSAANNLDKYNNINNFDNNVNESTLKQFHSEEEQGRKSGGEIHELASTLFSRLHERIKNISPAVRNTKSEEEKYLEDFAKFGGFWIDSADTKFGNYFDSGQEQSVYIDPSNTKVVTKLNDNALQTNWHKLYSLLGIRFV